MKRVTGLGGVFFKCRDREKTLSWYEKHLGIPMEPWGAQFFWEVPNASDSKPYSVLGMFKEQTDYFEPSSQPFMINFRVDDLDALAITRRSDRRFDDRGDGSSQWCGSTAADESVNATAERKV